MKTETTKTTEPFMTSAIGDLPINTEGMRKAVDKIDELMLENTRLTLERDDAVNRANEITNAAVNGKPAFMTSPIGDLPVNTDGLRTAIDEIRRLNEIINQTNAE